MQDQRVREQDVTPELLDRSTVIVATGGGSEDVGLRPDRRLGGAYGPSAPARISPPQTLYIVVPDYSPETLGRLAKLVEDSDARRRARK